MERFSKGQDLFDNIACIDSFWLNFVMLHLFAKSLAHTDYVYVYERLRDKYLKNPQCSWLVNKRNEVLKEKPFALEKQLILNLYLPHTRGVFPSEKFTIEDEVDYITLIESVKNIIENIPAIEVYFSTEFIYKEVGSDVNLFETTGYGINSILSLLTDLDKEIGIDVSKSRETIQEKISKLRVHKVPQDAWFTDDYVFYRRVIFFKKGLELKLSPLIHQELSTPNYVNYLA